MDKLYWLGQISKADREKVGDKAFYLNHLMQQGYPVVPGFVVGAKIFWEFLEGINWLEPLLGEFPHAPLYFNPHNPRQLQTLAQQIRQHILRESLSDETQTLLEEAVSQFYNSPLIFRPYLSSHTLSTSGLLEVQVVEPYPEKIGIGLKRGWAEFFHAKSLFYWHSYHLRLQKLQPTLLVHPLYSAIASGSVLANRHSDWEIQATWGLGMSLTWGENIADTYVIHPQNKSVKKQVLGNKTLAFDLKIEHPELRSLDGEGRFPLMTPLTESQFPPSQHQSPCLQAYLLSEAEQTTYALDQDCLQDLIELTSRVTSELNASLKLDWVLCQTSPCADPLLYLTQVSPLKAKEISHLNSQGVSLTTVSHFPSSHSRFIRGLAAASGKAQAIAQVVYPDHRELSEFPPGSILVAPEIHPDWLPWLKIASGVVAENGSMVGHGAILARELGIPAVVGVLNATRVIKTGTSLMIDGDKGEVYLEEIDMGEPGSKFKYPREMSMYSDKESEDEQENWERKHYQTQENQYLSMISSRLEMSRTNSGSSDLPDLRFSHPLATDLWVNLSQSTSLERLPGLPIDGIGLLRSELMLLETLEGQHPQWWLQKKRKSELIEKIANCLSQFAVSLNPRPVLYRSLDLRELNGKGAFSYELETDLFELELAALSHVYQGGYYNVKLMLPFVRTVEDFLRAKTLVDKSGLTQNPRFQLWIMAEVPSVLLLLPDYVKAGVQGISIGTNDLNQFLLGVDRNSSQQFPLENVALMRMLEQLIKQSQNLGIACSICGDIPSLSPQIIEDLVNWGISSISVDVDAVEMTYLAIARAEKRMLLKAARRGDL